MADELNGQALLFYHTWHFSILWSVTLKIGPLTKLGWFFPVSCFVYIYFKCKSINQTFANQLYRDKVTVWISAISELRFWGVFVISVASLSRSVCALLNLWSIFRGTLGDALSLPLSMLLLYQTSERYIVCLCCLGDWEIPGINLTKLLQTLTFNPMFVCLKACNHTLCSHSLHVPDSNYSDHSYLYNWISHKRPPLMSSLGGRLWEVVAYGKFH